MNEQDRSLTEGFRAVSAEMDAAIAAADGPPAPDRSAYAAEIAAGIAALEAELEADDDGPAVRAHSGDRGAAIRADLAELQAASIARDVRALAEGGQIGLDLPGVDAVAGSGPVDHLAAATAAIAEGERIRADIDFHQMNRGGDLDYVAAQRDAAARALRPDPVGAGPRAEAAALALAAGWYGEIDVADERLDELVDLYATRGVVINVDNDMAVTAVEPPVPAVGHGQRIAQLHALVAVNQARSRRERYLIDMDAAEHRGQAAADVIAEQIEVALELDEHTLAADVGGNRDAMAGHLAKALMWKEASPVAAARVEEITTALAAEWGVLVEFEGDEMSVRIDETFDAHTAQVEAEARAVRIRETAMADAIAAAALPEEVEAAVGEVMASWSDRSFESDPAQVYINSEPYRYRDLLAEVGKVQMPESDRAALEFTLDYLRDAVEGADLLETPVMVDPGEEARGRVPKLLDYYVKGEVAATEIAEEISVMTDEDQEAARQVGRDIAADRDYDTQLWPGYVDRDHIREELWLYGMDASEQRGEADYIVDEAASFATESPEMFGVSDEVGERVTRMATRRAELLEVAENGKGLTVAERRQITATVADIDSGRIADETQLPELMWLDERTKSEVDLMRGYEPASTLSIQARTDVARLIEASGAVEKGSHAAQDIGAAVSRVSDSIYSVAGGAPLGVENERHSFAEKRDRLGQALAKAGVDRDTKLAVRKVIDTAARQAGQLGRPAAGRRTQWKARTDAAVAARDDQAAQRRAVANQRAPRGNGGRNCATRPDRTAQPSSPAPARHTMRRNTPGVER